MLLWLDGEVQEFDYIQRKKDSNELKFGIINVEQLNYIYSQKSGELKRCTTRMNPV